MHHHARSLCLAILLGFSLAGCQLREVGSERDIPLQPGEALAGRDPGAAILGDGRRVYREYCVGCHGEAGDGGGPAARFLDPKPRDFTKGLFKFAGVASGDLPGDEDLMRTLVHGLPGSSMPSWRLLSDQERRAVVAYIKTFSSVWSERSAGTPIAMSDDPFAGGRPDKVRTAIDRGRAVYHVMATCWQCHPAYATKEEVGAMATAEGKAVTMRDGAERAVEVADSWGGKILPTDFPSNRLKSGSSVQDLYRTIASGVGGTAMPTWKGGLPENDLWALSYYVKSLADRRWQQPRGVPSQPRGGSTSSASSGE